MAKRKMKIIVLMGGPSQEHEVSLNTGKNIIQALDPKKYDALPITITKTGRWLFPATYNVSGSSSNLRTCDVLKLSVKPALNKLRSDRPDVAFIAMHGTYGEDGTLQGLLESIGLPYTGSGVLASALGMDKPRSCGIFWEAGLLVPDFEVINKRVSTLDITQIVNQLGWPIVVKPANNGSSVGISITKNKKELSRGLTEAYKYNDRIILQKFIKGREITCGVLESRGGKLLPLPPTEIVPIAGKFYDYKSKYADGGSEHIIPPRGFSPKMIRTVQDSATKAHNVIGCSGMSRSDFILGNDGKLYILEINTIPGMTQTSLLPEAARAAKITFPKLLDLLIKSALRKKRRLP